MTHFDLYICVQVGLSSHITTHKVGFFFQIDHEIAACNENGTFL